MAYAQPDQVPALFHYCSNEAFCSIIKHRAIWLSSLSLSNDTMEGKWIRRLFAAELKRTNIPEGHIHNIMNSFDFLVDSSDGLGFCLSEADDMLSQWRGYAANGEGVSIGFAKEFLVAGQEPAGERAGYGLVKVRYGEASRPDQMTKIVGALKKSSDEGLLSMPGLLSAPIDEAGWEAWRKKSVAAKMPILLLLGELFSVKNPAFREEREWRLLSLDFRALGMDVDFRARGDVVVPYRAYPFDPLRTPISKVILGPRNRSNEKDIVRFMKLYGFSDVDVARSTASYR